jgi:hypothetical protein
MGCGRGARVADWAKQRRCRSTTHESVFIERRAARPEPGTAARIRASRPESGMDPGSADETSDTVGSKVERLVGIEADVSRA